MVRNEAKFKNKANNNIKENESYLLSPKSKVNNQAFYYNNYNNVLHIVHCILLQIAETRIVYVSGKNRNYWLSRYFSIKLKP